MRTDSALDQQVAEIIGQVRRHGDSALLELTNKLDRRALKKAADFRLDNSDWTFEYWVRIVDTATSYFHVFTADGQNNRGTFKGYSPGSSITSMYFYSSQGNGLSHNTSSSFAHNAWMHVAWEFDDSADDFRLYIGGVLKETNTSMTFQGGNPSYAYFGRNTDQTNESQEFYIDNIRWTRGVCRYNGSNFTPPTSPYPTS